MAKLYVWVNSKLSSLQKGIQSCHVVREMVEECQDGSNEEDAAKEFYEWASRGKTIILLEGGSHEDLSNLADLLNDMPDDDDYPYAYFNEEDLNEAITAVGIVLDEHWDRENRGDFRDPNDWERALLLKLVNSREAL